MNPARTPRPRAALVLVGAAFVLVGAGLLPRAGEAPGGSPPASTPSERAREGVPVGHVVSTILRAGEGADDAPSGRTVVQRFRAEARPIDGIFGWSEHIVRRSAREILSRGPELHLSGRAELLVHPDRLEVRSGWYRWAIPWREVEHIYASDAGPHGEVVFVEVMDGEVITLSDIALGPAAYDVAAAGTEELVRLGRWD